MFIVNYQLYALMKLMKINLNVFFGPPVSYYLVLKIYDISEKMNHPTKILIIDQGTPIPKYLLSMITEVINSLVVTTEALAPNDCSGKINF